MLSIPIEDVIAYLESLKRVKMEIPLTHPSPPIEVGIKVIVSPYLAVIMAHRRISSVMKAGSSCILFFTTEEIIYFIYAKIKFVLTEGGLLLLEAVRAFKRSQERENFRFDMQMPVKFWFPDEVHYKGKFIAADKKVNISGGGIQVVSAIPVAENSELGLELHLPDGKKVIKCTGNVVRTIERSENEYDIALRFTRINWEDRERIIAVGFAQQRKRLRST